MHELRRIDNLILKCKLASAKTISIKLKTATIDDRCETSKKKKSRLFHIRCFLRSVKHTLLTCLFYFLPSSLRKIKYHLNFPRFGA